MRMSLFAALALAAAPALAQEGDVEAGRQLAEEVCSACHVVEPGAGFVGERLTLPFEPGVPLTFEDIANTSGVTEGLLLAWMATSHPNMPDLVLEPEELMAITAYILSLRAEEI
jgi:mono/diheme cytochrome c family protein